MKYNEVPSQQEEKPAAELTPFNVARLEMKKGSLTHTHHHDTECMLIVLEGACRVYLKTGTVTVRQNEMLRIPPQQTHVAEALADTVALSISSISSSAGEWTGCGPVFHHDADQYLWGV